LANARLTDPDNLAAQEKLDSLSEDYLDRSRKLERELKDKIRQLLGLPAHFEKKETNLAQHARNNGISPSYDLPEPDGEENNSNHTDDNIQTLFLPKDLERKLSALVSKCNTWIQETGINVLHVSFGFLEWKEANSTGPSFSPLILVPVKIEKNKTNEGIEFWVKGLGEEAETNTVLIEKLRLEFGIQLPLFEGGSIEDYLSKVSEISPKTLSWRVRRQVSFGVFPSARIAMYHYLDTQSLSFSNNEIIRSLFSGNNSCGAVPFADDYHVDEPEFEQKVPYLVLDADASQYSTLCDIASGENVAVEGPPGTGKSQTIVNAIASAMAAGKKVLFVSEKAAALNVVRSRLEAIGLGEFLLPLLAERSTRENVILSIRERLDMRPATLPTSYEKKISEFRNARDETAQYIKILTTIFKDTGMTVYDIIGKSISTSSYLDGLPKELQTKQFPISNGLTQSKIREIFDQAEILNNALRKSKEHSSLWASVGHGNLNRFDIDDILLLSKNLSVELERVDELLSSLKNLGLAQLDLSENHEDLKSALQAVMTLKNNQEVSVALDLAKNSASYRVSNYLNEYKSYVENFSKFQKIFNEKIDEKTIALLEELHSLCLLHGLTDFDDEALARKAQVNQAVVKKSRIMIESVWQFSERIPGSENWQLSSFKRIREIIDAAGRDALYFRSEILADPATSILLKKYNKIGSELASTGKALSENISPSFDISLEQLQECLSAIKQSGIFRIISSRYRRAKSMYAKISKHRFQRDHTVSLLEQYITWKRRKSEYLENTDVKSIYGSYFRGIDTDFILFDRMVDYYDNVREAFSSFDQQDIREFLFSGDPDHIFQSPALEIYPNLLSLKTMEEKLEQMEAENANLTDDSKRINELKRIFTVGKTIDAKLLPELISDLSHIFNERRRLDTDKENSSYLAPFFKGFETKFEFIEPILNIASQLERLGEGINQCCEVVAHGNTQAAINCILELEKSIASSRKIEAQLVSKAELASDSIMLKGQPGERATILAAASNDREGLFAFAEVARARLAVNAAIHDIIDEFSAATGNLEGIGQTLEALAYRSLARQVFEKYGTHLSKFSGNKLNELRGQIASIDKELILISRQCLRSVIQTNAKPPRGNGIGRKSSYTNMALIENETSKKKRFTSVRDLTRRAGKALLEIKPCWMMSPLAVAQYLPKGELSFDLCIIDEASQMTPEDAVGALSRCSKAMIVGDTNQLPPSIFFRKLVEDEDIDEDEAVLNESILEMANAVFRPARRLRWHYRSRHSGLVNGGDKLCQMAV